MQFLPILLKLHQLCNFCQRRLSTKKNLIRSNYQLTRVQNGTRSNSPVTLKIGYGHQNWSEHVKTDRGYCHAELKRIGLNCT